MTEKAWKGPATKQILDGAMGHHHDPPPAWLFGGIRETARRNWPAWFAAFITMANGLLNIFQVLLVRVPERPRLFSLFLPFGLHHWGRSLTLAFGFALVYLSLQLFQRRRTAWALAIAASIFALLVGILRGHVAYAGMLYAALAPGGTAILLIVFRNKFSVRTESRSIFQGIGLAISILVLATSYGTIGFRIMDLRDFGLHFQLVDAVRRTLREFVFVGNADLVPHTRHARFFLESLRVLGVAAGALAVYSLFRPVAYRLRMLPQERASARDILETHGRSSLDFFKLWPDKSYLFSASRRSFIAYGSAWSVAISLGDPVGPDDETEGTVNSFLKFCSDNGWTVALHQVLPDLFPIYQKFGLQVLKIGEEAIVDMERFSNITVRGKKFRHIRRRFESGGYTFHRYKPPHPPSLIEEVAEVSREWLSLPGRRERSFTLGRFERGYVSETPIAVLRDPEGHVIAFANEIPSYRQGEATIDLMRHRVEISNGAMDYLFVEMMLLLKEEGYRTFSMGLVPFVGAGDHPGATLEERALHLFFECLNRFFVFKGLRQYRAKFEPVWEDRFLAYQGGPPGLIKTAIALTRVTER